MGEERQSNGAGFNRRRFMRRAGAAAAGAVVVGAGAEPLLSDSKAADEVPGEGEVPLSEVDPNELLRPGKILGDTVAGVIIETGPQSVLVHPTEDSPITVNVLTNAELVIEGEVSLSAYEVGDEVIAVGERRGDEFVAKGMTIVFRKKEVTILARNGRLLKTSDGEILLLPWVVSEGGMWGSRRYQRVSPDDLQPGDEILAFGRVNQRTGLMKANNISVPANGENLLGP